MNMSACSRVIAEYGIGDLSSQVLCRGEYWSSTKKLVTLATCLNHRRKLPFHTCRPDTSLSTWATARWDLGWHTQMVRCPGSGEDLEPLTIFAYVIMFGLGKARHDQCSNCVILSGSNLDHSASPKRRTRFDAAPFGNASWFLNIPMKGPYSCWPPLTSQMWAFNIRPVWNVWF